MRPLVLKGHERSITSVTYNWDGDLIVSTSKAHFPVLWRSDTGERMGTYHGHNGALWCAAISRNSKYVLSGSADNTAKLWRLETGEEVFSFTAETPVRWVDFAEGDKQVLVVTDQVFGKDPTCRVYDISDEANLKDTPVHSYSVENTRVKITNARWGPGNRKIYCGHSDGTLSTWDRETHERVVIKAHAKSINSLVFSRDKSHFITCSADHTARLYDTASMELLCVYESDRPLNAVAMSPTRPHIVIGGGQDADVVTTTSTKVGQFQVRFFHKVFCNELASVRGHFGPINALAFAPDGTGFVSGGEDGYIRLHHFDKEYDTLEYKLD